MANNRLLLYCKECLGYVSLAKYYPTSWYSVGTRPYDEYMNEFFDKHEDCVLNYKGDIGFDADIFALTTESTWEGYLDWGCHKLYKEKPEWWDSGKHTHTGEEA
jgi:hypothetical protein